MNVVQNTEQKAPEHLGDGFPFAPDNEDGLDIPEFLKRDKDNNLPPKKEDTETIAVQSDEDFGGEARVLN